MKKTTIFLFAIVGITMFGSLTCYAQDRSDNELVLVRVVETGGTYAEIIIQRGSEQQLIPLDKNMLKPTTVQSNASVIAETLSDLKEEGYKITFVSSKGGGINAGLITITDYIFER